MHGHCAATRQCNCAIRRNLCRCIRASYKGYANTCLNRRASGRSGRTIRSGTHSAALWGGDRGLAHLNALAADGSVLLHRAAIWEGDNSPVLAGLHRGTIGDSKRTVQ